MAIHFDYIKGLNGDTTQLSGDNADSMYTYIQWASRTTNSSGDKIISKSASCLPRVIISINNALDSSSNETSQFDCGHIITSNATNQGFYQDTYRFKGTSTWFIPGETKGSSPYWGRIFCNSDSSQGFIGFRIETGTNFFINATGSITVSEGSANTSFVVNKKNSIFNGVIKVNSDSDTTTFVEISEGNIMAKGHIDSYYFNATSDRRAKTNIQYWDTSALDIVRSLPVYEFHYTNNNAPSIGVIAQEAAQFDDFFENFSLVDNPNATGENGDYMTIKESKLVYILWKAVQEQQEQIEQLKAELNKIKESR